jgi:signal transduction histidine kinase
MDGLENGLFKARNLGRRKEDLLIRDRIEKHHQLFHVGRIITSEINMDTLFAVIMDETNQIMDAERCTAFLYDSTYNQLWSMVATGMRRNEIRISATYGVAGHVFQTKEPVIINDAYSDPHFYREVDKKSGFRTRNIICVPLVNRQKECIGVFQALNKRSGEFTVDDMDLFVSLSYYVTIALENARLYEELKLLDKAKERVINHLSHEMKTPLAIIAGCLERISKKLADAGMSGLERTIDMGQRNLARLHQLQVKIDDILNQRSLEEKGKILGILEDALSFVEELRDQMSDAGLDILDAVTRRIESLYRVGEIKFEVISLDGFFRDLLDRTEKAMGGREIEVIVDADPGATLTIDRSILEKLCTGLLKNAIENTPDEGRIEVRSVVRNDGTIIEFHDFGVGITAENQKMIFGGFFHTQDTLYYSSKEPYAFNAGGSGSDLLRMKVFSERLGFSIAFLSERCRFIPADTDMCVGRVSQCPNAPLRSECFSSGGSTFTLKFPPQFPHLEGTEEKRMQEARS